MDYVVSRRVLSSDRDLFRTESGFAWTSSPPLGVMTYDVDFLEKNCARSSLFLAGLPYESGDDLRPFARAVGSFRDALPLSKFVPHEIFKNFVTRLVDRLDDHLRGPSYYSQHFVPQTSVFDALVPALIDMRKLSYHSSVPSNDVNRPVLATFLPDDKGFCRPIRYDRLTGRTGRLKVAQGPSILTLKKDHRDILISRYPGGKIISVDYQSLEARTFLYSSGVDIPEDDVYTALSSRLFGGEYPRRIVKEVVISLIYGMGDIALAMKLGLDKGKVRKLSKSVRKFFRYDELQAQLESKQKGDRILNHYGRSVIVPDQRLLLNTFVQSSAVDVVLHGFSRIVENIPDGSRCVPLFVLHDALIMDVAPGFDTSFVSIGERVPGYDGRFPVHVSSF